MWRTIKAFKWLYTQVFLTTTHLVILMEFAAGELFVSRNQWWKWSHCRTSSRLQLNSQIQPNTSLSAFKRKKRKTTRIAKKHSPLLVKKGGYKLLLLCCVSLLPLLLSGGEIFDQVCARGRFSEDESRYFFQQLISGVHYCHQSGKEGLLFYQQSPLLATHHQLQPTSNDEWGEAGLQGQNNLHSKIPSAWFKKGQATQNDNRHEYK